MKNRMTTLMLLAAVVFCVVLSDQALAQITPESLPCPTCRFGMVGITRGQTARLNVVNVSDVQCPSSDDVPPGACRAQVDLIFFDRLGRTLARSTETLTPGRAAFLDLNGDTLERLGARAEIRAAVITPPPDPDRSSRVALIATVEVFNNENGRTTVVVPVTPALTSLPSNDFSMSVSPATLPVSAGSSTNTQVSTAVTSGAAQVVSFAISGLPPGATASFSPTSVSAGGSSTLTITTASDMQPGSYVLNVTGVGTNATHVMAVSLTIN
jgi:hypothetical protein